MQRGNKLSQVIIWPSDKCGSTHDPIQVGTNNKVIIQEIELKLETKNNFYEIIQFKEKGTE